MDAAIGDDLDIAVGEKQVDQDAAILVGVPDAQQAEHVDRARARGDAGEHPRKRQRSLDREAHLSAMPLFSFADQRFDAL